MKILEVHNLTVQFGEHSILDDLCCDVEEGEILSIIGPNGAGKSTFLKTLLGLIPYQYGTIKAWGTSLPRRSVLPDAGYVPQRFPIDRNFPITVLELLLLGNQKEIGRASCRERV